MWKIFNPFKRRSEVPANETSNGKENEDRVNVRGPNVEAESCDEQFLRGSASLCNQNGNNCDNCCPRNVNGHGSSGQSGNSFIHQDGERSLGSGGCQNMRGGSFVTSSHDRLGTLPGASPSDRTDIPLLASSYYKSQNTNQSFCGVYGPLLSTPIVPKVRRALETSAGLRSPQTSALTNGRKVGRSVSLNYGSGNPARPTAGMVPWVRLKNKEAIPLSDIISGKLPRSPNTVKLGPPPEPRHLPMAPGFKSTPLIVTTEPSRARVVDTQTVVSALREKRKRLEIGQLEDPFSEDLWINAAKRRRQDSSQSNASSVSIPSMPESLPNLMGTPGVSLLHIENLKDQRPSTVPAMDAFISHHQREYGLGGELVGHNLQREEQGARSQTSSRTVLRSIQSSLSSSSLRSRTGLSTQHQQSGMDMNQIRDSSDGHDVTRQISQSSDICMMDQSDGEPQAKQPKETAATAPLDTAGAMERAVPASSRTSYRTLTERKIAEGVVLRKHNFSFASPGTSARLAQAHPMNSMITTEDIERDRQKEYRRRMMELLGDDEEMENTVSASTSSAQQLAVSASFHTAAASSAATSAAVSASLDSLNKLVQSTGAMLPPVSSTDNIAAVVTTSSLGQVLQTSDGKLPPSANATSFTLAKDTSLGFQNLTATPLNTTDVPSAVTATSSVTAGGGFNLGAPTSTESAGPAQVGAVAGGFQFNFPRSSSSSSISAASVTPAVSPANGQPSFSSGFTLGGNTASGFSTNSNATVECSTVTSFTSASTLPSSGTVDSMSKIVNPVISAIPNPNQGAASPFSPAQSGSAQEAKTFQGNASQLDPAVMSSSAQACSSVPQAQASFGNALTSVAQNHGFLSATVPSSSSLSSTSSTATSIFSMSSSSTSKPAMPSGFTFGASVSTSTPGNSFTANGSSQTASLEKPAPSPSGFNFGASSTTAVTTTASTAGLSQQAGGGFHFGVPSTGSLTSAPAGGLAQPSTAWTTQAGVISLHDQSTSSIFKGFGLTATSTSGAQFQNAHPPTAPATATVPPIFSSGSAAFGTSSSTSQQPFGNSSQVLQTPFGNPPQGSQPSFGNTVQNPQQSFGNSTQITQPSFGNTLQNPQQSFGNSVQIPQPSFGNTSQNPQQSFGNNAQIPQQSFGNSAQIPQSSFGNTSKNTQQSFGNAVQNSQTPFGNSSQMPQQPFGVSSQQPFGTTLATATAFSQFNTAATTTTNSGIFAFGQTPATTASPQPFTFGAFSAQPSSINLFGGGTTVTASASPFGNTTSLTFSASTPSILGSGSTSAFTSSVSNATTVFGPVSTPSVFGSAKNPATAFGAAPPPGGQAPSLFAMPAASSGTQLFNFGASTGGGTQATQPTSAFGASLGARTQAAQPTSAFVASMGSVTQATQPASVFGANPTPSFGSGPSAPGSSMFAAKPPAFGGASVTTPSVFGSAIINPSTPAASTFGSNFGSSNPFGGGQATDKPSFGAASTAFGATNTPVFTAPAQGSLFGTQNPSTNIFGSASQNPAPAFGSQQGLAQASNANLFASSLSGKADAFGGVKPNTFGSATPSQGGFNFSAAQPGSFGSQASSGFNFVQPGAQPAALSASNTGFSFAGQTSARPTFQTPSQTGFNFAAAAASPSFNFSGTPSNPNPFSPMTPNAPPRPRVAGRRPIRKNTTLRR